MPLPFRSEDLVERFGPYLDELREFLTSRRLQFGSPNDLAAFSERLAASASFQDEMASMVRAILYSEEEAISRKHLSSLVLLAVSGPPPEEPGPEWEQQARRVQTFVEASSRPTWSTGPTEAADATSEPEDISAVPENPAEWASTAPDRLSFSRLDATSDEPHTPARIGSRATAASPINSALSRALTQSGLDTGEYTGDTLRSAEEGSSPANPALSHHSFPFDPVDPDEHTASEGMRRNLPWVAACAAVLLAFFAGFFLRSRTLDSSGSTPTSAPLTRPADPTQQPESSSLESSNEPESTRVERTEDAASGSPRSDAGNAPPSATPRSSRPSVAPQGVFFVSSGVMTANLLSAPSPEYPKVASLVHIEGPVILQAVIAKDGTVVATHALSGHHLLRSAAERAVRRWRYRPYMDHGKPTEVVTVVTVEFRIHH